MSSHHEMDKFSVPDGVSVEDMDWLAFSWEIRGQRPGGEGEGSKQIIVLPGAIIERSGGPYGTNFWEGEEPRDYFVEETSKRNGSSWDFALYLTSVLERDGWNWVRTPFVVDFTENDLHLTLQSRFISKTLGDTALLFGSVPGVAEIVFDHVARKRSTIPEIHREASE